METNRSKPKYVFLQQLVDLNKQLVVMRTKLAAGDVSVINKIRFVRREIAKFVSGRAGSSGV